MYSPGALTGHRKAVVYGHALDVLVQCASTNQITAAKQDTNTIVFIQHFRVGYIPIFNYCVFTIGGGEGRIKEYFKERLNNYCGASTEPFGGPNAEMCCMQIR